MHVGHISDAVLPRLVAAERLWVSLVPAAVGWSLLEFWGRPFLEGNCRPWLDFWLYFWSHFVEIET